MVWLLVSTFTSPLNATVDVCVLLSCTGDSDLDLMLPAGLSFVERVFNPPPPPLTLLPPLLPLFPLSPLLMKTQAVSKS